MLLLGGCGRTTSYNPVDWWHDLLGGPIADTRPPPPNADAPYPNLGSVPEKPSPPDAAARGKVSSGLIADRANAQYTASLSPLQAAPAPGTPPPQRPAPRAASADVPNATLQAAAGPPPLPQVASSGQPARPPQGPPQLPLANVPVTPPHRAPTTSVQAAPLAAPAEATPAATPLPTMPDHPPAPPNLSGVPVITVPTPPAATPVPPAPAPVVVEGAPVAIGFAPGSSSLPSTALAPLKALALKRGDASISVTGFGEASSSDASAQSAALPLALARARAIAANLLSAGVPANAIRINAEAAGSGGAAHLGN